MIPPHSSVFIVAIALAATTPLPLFSQTDPRVMSAESAAPPSVSGSATIVDVDGTTLRMGRNGWTCYPDFPETTGHDPMCFDARGMEWFAAFRGDTAPDVAGIGFGYMLGGDAAASNTDPFATGPTADNEWMPQGIPHIMMIVADPATLEGLPESPSDGGPWVMWRDTPFVHVMLPVAEPGQFIMAH